MSWGRYVLIEVSLDDPSPECSLHFNAVTVILRQGQSVLYNYTKVSECLIPGIYLDGSCHIYKRLAYLLYFWRNVEHTSTTMNKRFIQQNIPDMTMHTYSYTKQSIFFELSNHSPDTKVQESQGGAGCSNHQRHRQPFIWGGSSCRISYSFFGYYASCLQKTFSCIILLPGCFISTKHLSYYLHICS